MTTETTNETKEQKEKRLIAEKKAAEKAKKQAEVAAKIEEMLKAKSYNLEAVKGDEKINISRITRKEAININGALKRNGYTVSLTEMSVKTVTI